MLCCENINYLCMHEVAQITVRTPACSCLNALMPFPRYAHGQMLITPVVNRSLAKALHWLSQRCLGLLLKYVRENRIRHLRRDRHSEQKDGSGTNSDQSNHHAHEANLARGKGIGVGLASCSLGGRAGSSTPTSGSRTCCRSHIRPRSCR